MNDINFSNLNISTKKLPFKGASQQQESFGAIDKAKLKEDTMELSNKAKDRVETSAKQNWFVKKFNSLVQDEDKKKRLKSIGLAIATTIGLAYLGNKSVDFMADLGIKAENSASKKLNKIKPYVSLKNGATKLKNNLKNTLETNRFTKKFVSDIKDTFKNRHAKPSLQIARGSGQGPLTIFSITPVETFKNAIPNALDDNNKFTQEAIDKYAKILKGDKTKAVEMMDLLYNSGKDNSEIVHGMTKIIKEANGLTTKAELKDFLVDLKHGKFGDDFIDVTMKDSGLMAIQNSWWPVNVVNNIKEKITGKPWKGAKGNGGDALLKFNMVSGDLADTKFGSLIQKSVVVPTECISNFVNDKSGLGAILCLTQLPSSFDRIQNAPKEKKGSTIADEFLGQTLHWAIVTPLAFKATYGLASLANLKGDGILSKAARLIGKPFNIGLNKTPITKSGLGGVAQKLGNSLKGTAGGVLRFALVLFVFSSLFSKPIDKLTHKVFGKPYDANEEEKNAQIAEAKKQIIPELGISQAELEEKINNNPKAVEEIQKNPQLVQEIQQNPKKLLEILEPNKATIQTANNVKSPFLSQASKDLIQKRQQNTSQMGPVNQPKPNLGTLNENNLAQLKTSTKQPIEGSGENNKMDAASLDTATYIPSSENNAPEATISDSQAQELEEILAKSDKVIKKAESYI